MNFEEIELHLCRLHTVKDVNLKITLNEIQNLCFPLCAKTDLIISYIMEFPISELTIVTDNQCTLTACNDEAATLSASCQTVEKHLAQVHRVGCLKAKKPDSERV